MNNKNKLIETATQLFHTYGFNETSMNMLTKTSGVSTSNFYYYFKSKEELALKITKDMASEFDKTFFSKTISNPSFSPLKRFNSFYAKIIFYQNTLFTQNPYPGCFFGNLALEQSGVNEKFRILLEDLFSKWKVNVEECIEDGIEQGFFNEYLDPKATADLLISQIEGAILLCKVRQSIEAFESTCEEVRKLVIKKEWR